MSELSWTISLEQTIRSTNKPPPRIAIVGMGHELRGDDAVGVMVARRLQALSNSNWLVLDAGPAPENFSSKLCEFSPDILLLVDAVQMDALPGSIRLLAVDDTEIYSVATHALSPHLWITYLQIELNCVIKLLGIQVGQCSLGTLLSSPVSMSAERIVQVIEQLVRTNTEGVQIC